MSLFLSDVASVAHRVSFDTISRREVAHLVRTEMRAICQRRRWELYHGNGESWNPLVGAERRVRRVHRCSPTNHIPTNGVHWEGVRNVTVRTVPLTWSESPLIIRPFAKFSPRIPFPVQLRLSLSLSLVALTWCARTFDDNERWAKGEETRRKPCSLPNRKHAFNKTRFAWYVFLARLIFYSSSIWIALSNRLIHRNTLVRHAAETGSLAMIFFFL